MAQVKELFERLDPNVDAYQQEPNEDGEVPRIMPTKDQVFRWWLDHHRDGLALRSWFGDDRTEFSKKVWKREMQVGNRVKAGQAGNSPRRSYGSGKGR